MTQRQTSTGRRGTGRPRHGDGTVVSARAFGELVGVTPATVGEWLDAGLPAEREGNGAWRISTARAVAWLEARARASAERANQTPADEADGRARKAIADAELAELKLARLRGEVVPIEDYRRELTRICMRIRARLLAMPGEHASRVVGLPTMLEATAALRGVARDVIAELRDMGRGDNEPDDAPDGQTEAAA